MSATVEYERSRSEARSHRWEEFASVFQFVDAAGAPFYYDFAQDRRMEHMPLPMAARASPTQLRAAPAPPHPLDAADEEGGQRRQEKKGSVTWQLDPARGEAEDSLGGEEEGAGGSSTQQAALAREREISPPFAIPPERAPRDTAEASAARLRHATRALCMGMRARFEQVRFRAVRLSPVSVKAILAAASALGLDPRSGADCEMLAIAELAMHSPTLPAGWREMRDRAEEVGAGAKAEAELMAADADLAGISVASRGGLGAIGRARKPPTFEHTPTGARSDKHPFELDIARMRKLAARIAARMADDPNVASLEQLGAAGRADEAEARLAEAARVAMAAELAADPVTAAALSACGALASFTGDGLDGSNDYAAFLEEVAVAAEAIARGHAATSSLDFALEHARLLPSSEASHSFAAEGFAAGAHKAASALAPLAEAKQAVTEHAPVADSGSE